MAYATYTAKRGLVAYHTEDVDYTLSFETMRGARPSASDLKKIQTSLSGVQETQFYGEQRMWTITTAPVQIGTSQEQLMVEFLRSTADGQSFLLDPYSKDGSVLPMTVERCDDGYMEDVFQEIDGVVDYVKFTFKVLEA